MKLFIMFSQPKKDDVVATIKNKKLYICHLSYFCLIKYERSERIFPKCPFYRIYPNKSILQII